MLTFFCKQFSLIQNYIIILYDCVQKRINTVLNFTTHFLNLCKKATIYGVIFELK